MATLQRRAESDSLHSTAISRSFDETVKVGTRDRKPADCGRLDRNFIFRERDSYRPRPDQLPAGTAKVFIYHRNSHGSEKHPCCKSDETLSLNDDSLAKINEIGNYVVYEVEAPFPMSLLFWSQFTSRPILSSGCAGPGCILTYSYGPPRQLTKIHLHLQVEAGKNYYIQFRPEVIPSSMKLMKEEIALRDMAGLKLADQKHIVPPTVKEAIGIVNSDLRQTRGSDSPYCLYQPMQNITVKEDGLQFTEVGKVDKGFRKDEYSVLVSMRFEGMSYLRMPANDGRFNSLNLPVSDFKSRPGFYVMPCVEELTSDDLPRFIEAVNRLIWNASGGKQ